MELSFNFKKLNQSFTIGSSAQIDSSPKTLSSAIAGSWYPRTAVELDAFLGKISAKIPNTPDESPPNVLLLPHAGYPYSAECAMHGIKLINNANFTRVVLLAPNHRRHVSNKLIAPESDFAETPYGTIPIDHEGINQLAKLIPIELNDSSHYEEHSTQIEYPLLQYALGDKFKLIPLIVGEVTDDFADCAAKALRQ